MKASLDVCGRGGPHWIDRQALVKRELRAVPGCSASGWRHAVTGGGPSTRSSLRDSNDQGTKSASDQRPLLTFFAEEIDRLRRLLLIPGTTVLGGSLIGVQDGPQRSAPAWRWLIQDLGW